MIPLTVNGKAYSLESPPTVAHLVECLELQGKRIALECNGEIIPRSQFHAVSLQPGDSLEVVVAVGGG
jgi:sulfur carrier protein